MRDLLKLLMEHKGGKAVTITVSFENSAFAHKINEAHVRAAIKTAETELNKLGENHKQLSLNLETVLKEIDFTHPGNGVGIFVSAKIAKWVSYFLPVKEKTIVGETFDTGDILYSINELPNYYVLSLSDNHTKLYKCKGKQLDEVKDNNFPMHYVEEHQYAQTPSHLDVGVDVSAVEQMREVQYLRKVDHALSEYLTKEKLPLVVMGVTQHLSFFDHVTKNALSIAAQVRGNFDHQPISKLETLAFQEIAVYQRKLKEQKLKVMKEDIGKHLFVEGLHETFNAAFEGKGDTLLVEKDFGVMGVLNGPSYYLVETTKNEVMPKDAIDIVNTVIQEVMNKGGKVLYFDDHELINSGRIALHLRYV